MIHNRSSFVNRTLFQTKMGKVYTRFQTKTAQKLYPLGPHMYLYVLYKGVPSPPPPRVLSMVLYCLKLLLNLRRRGEEKPRDRSLFIACRGGGGEDFGLNKVKFSPCPL